MSLCHSASQVSVGWSAADLAHHLASRAALPAEAEHKAQRKEQSAQRSGGHLSGAHRSVLLCIRYKFTDSGAAIAQQPHGGLLVQFDVTSACVPLLSAVLNSKWHRVAGQFACPRTLWCRLLPVILHGVSHCVLILQHEYWLSSACC